MPVTNIDRRSDCTSMMLAATYRQINGRAYMLARTNELSPFFQPAMRRESRVGWTDPKNQTRSVENLRACWAQVIFDLAIFVTRRGIDPVLNSQLGYLSRNDVFRRFLSGRVR